MAVSSTASEVRYDGAGSTGPFPVTFPYLDTAHIYVALIPEEDADPVLLGTSEFRIARSGTATDIYTTDAVEVGEVLVIFREVPLTQPTTFQTSGPFPAASAETALDRLEMQVQQISRRLDALGGGSIAGDGSATGNLTWADAAARATVTPKAAGQLGVQVDTQSIWIAQSTTTGDWLEFRPRLANRLILGYTADAGQYSAEQVAVADLFDQWACDAVLFAGGGNYSGIGTGYSGRDNYDDDWFAFADWITDGKAYPALGDVDVDFDGWETRHATKFSYLAGQNGGRYYKVTLGGGLVDLFVLHSGFNSLRDLVEVDGNEVGSDQHAWFVAALGTSTARWKIAMFHMPPASSVDDATRVASEMAWPQLAQMDLILCGKAHLLELVRWKEVMLANLSAVVLRDGTAGADLTGDVTLTDREVFTNDAAYGCGRIIASMERLEIEIWKTDETLLLSRSFSEFTVNPPGEVTADVLVADSSDGHTYKLVSTDGVPGFEEVS